MATGAGTNGTPVFSDSTLAAIASLSEDQYWSDDEEENLDEAQLPPNNTHHVGTITGFLQNLLQSMQLDHADEDDSDHDDQNLATHPDNQVIQAEPLFAQHPHGQVLPPMPGSLLFYAGHRLWGRLGERLTAGPPWESLRDEIMDSSHTLDGSTVLHIAMSSSTCPPIILQLLVDLSVFIHQRDAADNPFAMIGGEGKNTPLHYFAFRNNCLEVLDSLVKAHPTALLHVNRYGRVPAQTACAEFAVTRRPNHAAINIYLRRITVSYSSWIVQKCLHKCAVRHFVSSNLDPFSEEHRELVGVERASDWFAISVIGWFIQRECTPAAISLLQFVSAGSY
jgi:hypothetical protein